jgi:penicillin-binding protein 1C
MKNGSKDFAGEQIQKTFASKRKKRIKWMLLIFVTWYIFSVPFSLFEQPTSTVLLARDGKLLGARIANDGQWRFAPADTVPVKFQTCLIAFEDRQFYNHFGVSLKSTMRALQQNFKYGKRKSGGSTLTMQVIRLSRNNPPRTYWEKILEMIRATRIEWQYSKEEILAFHAANAPFGNNVVGLEAASWRYFNRPSWKLSWSECAVLAILPNAPGLIYPGKNQQQLLAKRNRLLYYLFEIQKIDKTTLDLALTEPLPTQPLPLPQLAPHLLDRLIKEGHAGQTIVSTLSYSKQIQVQKQLQQHALTMSNKKVHNAAAMIADVESGEVLAYVGNVPNLEDEHAPWVDCIRAGRSSGSILKPFLFASALEKGTISSQMLLSDVPSSFGAFSPQNFSGQFEGAVPASKALSKSLNLPFVHLLEEMGVSHFLTELRQMGFSTLKKVENIMDYH